MFHTKQFNNRINSLHEKALRVTYQDRILINHYRNIKYLLTEIYKVKMGLYTPTMSDIFRLSDNSSYNLRCGVTVNKRNIENE